MKTFYSLLICISLVVMMPLKANADSGIRVENNWWGQQIFIPESEIQHAGGILGLAGSIASIIPGIGPAVAAYMLAEAGAIALVDKGQGVCLTSTLATPNVFVPTPM
jgi:hypothetical protein